MLLGVKPSLCCFLSNQRTKLCYRRKKKNPKEDFVCVGGSLRGFSNFLKLVHL